MHEDCPGIRDDIWSMMQKCWMIDPNVRPSMQATSLLLNVIAAQGRLCGLEANDASCDDNKQLAALTNVHSSTKSHFSRRMVLRNLNAYTHNIVHCLSPTYRRTTSENLVRLRNIPPFKTAPYPCHWRGCAAQFMVLKECQVHELHHVEMDIG
jgi:hypothetical protein